jgi:hypothetical protein
MGLVKECYNKELYEELEKLEPAFYHASVGSPEETKEYSENQFNLIKNVLLKYGIIFTPDFYSINRDREKEKKIELSIKMFNKISETKSIRSDDWIEIRPAGYKTEKSKEEDPEERFRKSIIKPEEPHYSGDVF